MASVGTEIAALYIGRHAADDMDVVVATYVTQLKDQPKFAILLGLLDYKEGAERARKLDCKPSFPPSAAQVWQLAEHHRNELARQHDMIADVIESKKIAAPAAQEKRPLPADYRLPAMKTQTDEEKARKAYLDEEARKRDEAFALGEFKRAGVEPFYSRGGMLIVLPMCRQMERDGGLRLESAGPRMKRYVLTAPTPPAPAADDGGDDGP